MHIFHNWRAYETQTALVGFIWAGEPTRPVTFVKYRCETCKKVKRDELDGHWALKELNDG